MPQTVGIMANASRGAAVECAAGLARWLREDGVEVRLQAEVAEAAGDGWEVASEEELGRTGLLVAAGGGGGGGRTGWGGGWGGRGGGRGGMGGRWRARRSGGGGGGGGRGGGTEHCWRPRGRRRRTGRRSWGCTSGDRPALGL